jgi:hypothetical protein
MLMGPAIGRMRATMLLEITPLILTFNEAPNLRRTLDKLTWAREVMVLDSYSTDATESIARSFANVIFIQRRFDSFAEQCNAGLKRIETDWVLSLDADYVVTDELRAEIEQLSSKTEFVAYFARFRYCVAGRPLRGSLYPPRAVLFRKSGGRYVQDGHAHRLVFDGPSQFLRGYLLHDDRKPLARWLESQQGYARQEAKKLLNHSSKSMSKSDTLRCWIWPAAPAAFLYTLIVKRCLLDGWPGWYYALQRTYAELLLSIELLDRRLFKNEDERC